MAEKFNVRREDLIAVIRYPDEDDPLMTPTAVCYAEGGFGTRFVRYDPDTWEIQEDTVVNHSPEIIKAVLEAGEIEAAGLDESGGTEVVAGDEIGLD
jgi:hypothetical protein